MDSHITESEAIRLTDAELKAKIPPESIAKLEALHERMRMNKSAKALQRGRKIYN
jgi:hypothetical protein